MSNSEKDKEIINLRKQIKEQGFRITTLTKEVKEDLAKAERTRVLVDDIRNAVYKFNKTIGEDKTDQFFEKI